MGGQFLINGLPGLAGIADGLVASVMSGLDKLKFLQDFAAETWKILRAVSS